MTTFGAIVAFGVCYLAVGVAVASIMVRLEPGPPDPDERRFAGVVALVWPAFAALRLLDGLFQGIGWLARKVADR